MSLQADGTLTLKAFTGLLQKLGFAGLGKGESQHEVHRPAPLATSGSAVSATLAGSPLVEHLLDIVDMQSIHISMCSGIFGITFPDAFCFR